METTTVQRGQSDQAPSARFRLQRSWRRWRPRWSLTHGVMVVAGLLTFLLIVGLLHDRSHITEFAVLRAPLLRGEALAHSHVEYIPVPGAPAALVDFVHTPASIDRAIAEGFVTSRTLTAGVLLGQDDLTAQPESGARRLMSLPLDRTDAVDDRLVMGDVVDVVAFAEGRALIVVAGAEVAAVTSAGGPAGTSASLALAVDAAESLRLAWALGAASVRVVKATGAPAARRGASYAIEEWSDGGP